MGLITWNDHYSVKVTEIDEQHKKLIALANQLYDAMRAGNGRDVLGPVLTELVEYTTYHFESEERLLLQHGYPEHDDHKEQHDSLAEKARQFRDDFRQGQESRGHGCYAFSEQLAEHPHSRSGQALCGLPARKRRFLTRRKTLETARAKTRHCPDYSSRQMTVPPSYCFLSLHISSFSQARGLPEPLGHRLSVGNPQLSGP